MPAPGRNVAATTPRRLLRRRQETIHGDVHHRATFSMALAGCGRAERARRGIAAASGGTSISYGLADLDDLDAVRAFARQFCATNDRLDVLIHNASCRRTDA